jgi:hypothetical protein
LTNGGDGLHTRPIPPQQKGYFMDYTRVSKIKHLIKLARAIFELAKIEEDLEKLEAIKEAASKIGKLLDAEPMFHPELGFNIHEFAWFRIDIIGKTAVDNIPGGVKMKCAEYAAEIEEMLKGTTAFIKEIEPQLAQPIPEDDSTIRD